VVGDLDDPEAWRRVRVDQAALVAATGNDFSNTNVSFTVRVERNVSTLHRAGADRVMSYASLGASSILNLLRRGSLRMVAEGLDLFRVRVPASLAGKKLGESGLRERTGCSVVAIAAPDGKKIIPGPEELLPRNAELVLIGSIDAESRFLELYGDVEL
jgi:Trk K+ transport system NAD-binding subunit